MRDAAFIIVIIRDHAFFEQAVFQRPVCHIFLQTTGFAALLMHLASGCDIGGIFGDPALARFHKLLEPGVVETLSDSPCGTTRQAPSATLFCSMI